MTDALSILLSVVCLAFRKHVCYEVLFFFSLLLARVSVLDD